MTTAKTVGAGSIKEVDWHSINWKKAHRNVRRLQARIVKAQQEGNTGKVRALQWILTHSFSAKALAVKRVTQNQGKNSPGVDRITWSTPEKKADAIKSTGRQSYKASPLRRVYIPKKNGKMRPLGILTIQSGKGYLIVKVTGCSIQLREINCLKRSGKDSQVNA